MNMQPHMHELGVHAKLDLTRGDRRPRCTTPPSPSTTSASTISRTSRSKTATCSRRPVTR